MTMRRLKHMTLLAARLIGGTVALLGCAAALAQDPPQPLEVNHLPEVGDPSQCPQRSHARRASSGQRRADRRSGDCGGSALLIV